MTAPTFRLPCGRSPDDILDQVADGHGGRLDEHQQHCPHCRAALTETGRLWAPVADLGRERVDVPPSLLNDVMTSVRALVADVWHAVLRQDRGTTRIAARAIAVVARSAAQRIPGVRVAIGRSTTPKLAAAAAEATRLHRNPGAAVGVAGEQIVVDLALAVDYGLDLMSVADAVRDAVMADLGELAGLNEARVDITVDDVLPRRGA